MHLLISSVPLHGHPDRLLGEYTDGPFGEVLKKTGIATACLFGFSAKDQDNEMGVLYFRLPINVLAMADGDDQYEQHLILELT